MATWSGGQRLSAGRLTDVSKITTLDDRNSVPASYASWGSDLTFDNPGVDVAVCAWLAGRAYNAVGTGKLTLMYRIEISTDNGVQWSQGTEQWITVEPSGVSGSDQKSVNALHRAQALPTGTIRVRARVQSAGGTDIALRSGQLMAQVVAV